MRLPRLSATILAILAGGTLLSACDGGDHKAAKAILSAPPGRFTSVIGIGPDGDPETKPGWFEDPIDLAPAPGSGILVLTKEYGRVFQIRPDGSHRQLFSLTTPGDALSMAVQSDGTILVAQIDHKTGKLVLWRLLRGQTPERTGEQSPPRNADSVHLVRTPDGKILLLKDGRFLQQSESGKYEPWPYPKGLSAHTNILAAVSDGNSLMLLSPTALVWIRDENVLRRVPIAGLDAHDGAAISPDGSGGAFKARYGPSIQHYSPQGREGAVLLGYGGITGCGSGPISGVSGYAKEQKFDKATALLSVGKQLYFADPDCHRVLVIGLPSKEYIPASN